MGAGMTWKTLSTATWLAIAIGVGCCFTGPAFAQEAQPNKPPEVARPESSGKASQSQPASTDKGAPSPPPAQFPPPPQAAPPKADVSTGITLPQSQTRFGLDMCGQPIGTRYAEGAACASLEKAQGPWLTYKQPWESTLTMIAAGMAVIFLALYCILLLTSKGRMDEAGTRNFIVIAVIGSAVFVLTAGYDEKQVAPLYGLLGTLVGYLFGRSQLESKSEQSPAQPPSPGPAQPPVPGPAPAPLGPP